MAVAVFAAKPDWGVAATPPEHTGPGGAGGGGGGEPELRMLIPGGLLAASPITPESLTVVVHVSVVLLASTWQLAGTVLDTCAAAGAINAACANTAIAAATALGAMGGVFHNRKTTFLLI
jgi:hypothetical protein